MRRDYFYRWIMLICYITMLFWMVDFKIIQLFHLKSFLFVIMGTIFLTLSKYSKTITLKELLELGKWNCLITGFILTFLMNLTNLNLPLESNKQILAIALNFRPLFYSSIIYLLLNQLNISELNFNSRQETNIPMQNDINQLKILSNDLITDELLLKFKMQFLLTQREFEISKMLLTDYSNLEISKKLILSEHTIKKHISNIYKKCLISSRDQLRLLISKLSNE